MDGWVDGWMEGGESRVKDCLQQSKNKTKMVQSLKIKFLIISKLNFNEGQIYKKYQILIISKIENFSVIQRLE